MRYNDKNCNQASCYICQHYSIRILAQKNEFLVEFHLLCRKMPKNVKNEAIFSYFFAVVRGFIKV
jgi:hypothetical protein